MQRVHRTACQQFMGFHAHQHIRRFDTDDQIVISQIFDHVYLVQCALHNTFRSHSTVFFHQRLLQGTAVHSHTDRDIPLFCCIYHSLYPLRISDIPRIDADLVGTVLNGCQCHTEVKMDIRH